MGNTGKITSYDEGGIQWDINSFRQTWDAALAVNSPEFTVCNKRYILTLKSIKDIQVIEIHLITPFYFKTMENYYIELQLRTECKTTSDLYRIATYNTKFNDLRFFIDFREFLMNGKPLSDCLTIIFIHKQLKGHENLADKSYSMNKIQEDLKGLLATGINSDVELIVGEKKFLVHKNILSARSSVFKEILKFDALTRDDGYFELFDVKDCDPDTFYDFLTYVYTGSIKHINNENVISLYTTAVSYGVVELKAACMSFMSSNMSVDVFCSRAIFALRYDEKELIENSKIFFCMKAKEILETENWLNFMVESPKEVNEIFLKALAKNC